MIPELDCSLKRNGVRLGAPLPTPVSYEDLRFRVDWFMDWREGGWAAPRQEREKTVFEAWPGAGD